MGGINIRFPCSNEAETLNSQCRKYCCYFLTKPVLLIFLWNTQSCNGGELMLFSCSDVL